MSSYILNDTNGEKPILLYQETNGFEFTPKSYKKVKKITVLDKEILNSVLESKVIKKYNRLLQIVYALISSDDTTSGDVLVAFTEISRIRDYLLSLSKHLDKEFVDKYIKKLYVLELELKKVHVMELEEEIESERGMGR